jgi:hypothetical protein
MRCGEGGSWRDVEYEVQDIQTIESGILAGGFDVCDGEEPGFRGEGGGGAVRI